MFVVYRHTCVLNGKSYVGWTSRTIRDRWNDHILVASQMKNGLFAQAIRKHGVQCWKHDVLQICSDVNEAKQIEISWIARLNTNHFAGGTGYNMTNGGDGTLGHKHSTETRQKLSSAGRSRSVKARERMKKTLAKTNARADVKARRSLAQKTLWQDDVVRERRLKGAKNRPPQSDETKRKRYRVITQCNLEGNVLRVFLNVTLASQETGFNLQGIIRAAYKRHVVQKGVYKGFRWVFLDELEVENEKTDVV